MNDIIYPSDFDENIVQGGYEPKLPDACYPDSGISGIGDIDTFGNPMITMDMFGNSHLADPMDVDIMSGIPSSEFHGNEPMVGNSPSFQGAEVESYEQMRLDKGNEIEAMRDTAVQHYNDAKASGNIDEMLKWEAEANKQQGRLYDHWGTPTYGLPPKAPGIS